MIKKSVGIITMHKVWNFGSALQAYATQYAIDSLGYSAELIDYKYPNLEHSAFQNRIVQTCNLNIQQSLRLLLSKIKSKICTKDNNLFEKFYFDNFRCSKSQYFSRLDLHINPPHYDIYLSGSDQVWNPNYIGFDTTFMLDFVPEQSKKVSFASSFSVSEIPSCFKKLYKPCLDSYSYISVRESSGKRIIKELTGKEAQVVCDPTLLLDASQWLSLVDRSYVKVSEPYLLVYIMGYAYNPYPDIYNYIERVNNELQLPIIYVNAHPGKLGDKFKEIKVGPLGPNEFLYLVSHASFVITDSFHGTAFSLNFERRFISCVKSLTNSDSRMLDLLHIVGEDQRAVVFNQHDQISFEPLSSLTVERLKDYRVSSIQYLKQILG